MFWNSTKPGTAILLVDDEKLMHMLLEGAIEPLKYPTLSAFNGEEALKLAESRLPVLILLDIMMPKMNGVETLTRLKANVVTKNIPVLMLSALERTKDVEKALLAGAVGYIVKPFSVERIRGKILEAIKIHGAQPS